MERNSKHPADIQRNRDHYLDVARSIDDRSYFKEGLDWYKEICLMPVCERSYLIIVTVAACFAFAVTVINMQLIADNTEKIPLVVDVKESSNDGYYTKKLSDDIEESPQLSVADFMIRSYIQAMESYSPDLKDNDNMAARLRTVKTMSSKNIFNKYRSYMSMLNTKSPLRRYNTHTSRQADVYAIEYSRDYLFNAHASVYYRVTETPLTPESKLEKPVTTRWVADLHFRLSDVESIARSEAPIKFQVTTYTSREDK